MYNLKTKLVGYSFSQIVHKFVPEHSQTLTENALLLICSKHIKV